MAKTPTLEDIDACTALLSRLCEDPALLSSIPVERRVALQKAAGYFSRPHKEMSRLRNKALFAARRESQRAQDKAARANTGIRAARNSPVFEAPAKRLEVNASDSVLSSPRNCYVCKAEFTTLHFFYDLLCPPCAELNYRKRFQTASLEDQVAVITGARLKIGYHAALMMLRAGARVVATTRFPIDAAGRFAREPDFDEWGNRLQVFGLDLRHTPSVEIFAQYLCSSLGRLDILVNNAAQTVRRPPAFYSHLISGELAPLESLSDAVRGLLASSETCKSRLSAATPSGSDAASLLAFPSQGPGIGLRASARLSQVPYAYDQSVNAAEIFPSGKLDADLQQVDLRQTNSWRLKLSEVASAEMLEVQLVNAVAPFVLCSKLEPLLTRDFTGKKHIVNVSAMEGKFHRFKKADRHPHTNMAKAALNMLTHTSASDLEKKGIYMNSVDTGWVTDEDPAALSEIKKELHDFQPPLDIVDGAARVCDPFFDGINTGKHFSGKFLKDYFPIDW
jgi:NAD(P)-dependent dehydrogenase (short-subunit alcohol dehydrogenase family)